MIISRLCGGLGNQLFQYAAGRRLADARGVDLILDLSWFDRHEFFDTQRDYELDHYSINARKANSNEKFWFQFHRGKILSHIPFIPKRWLYYKERAFNFDSRLIDLPDNSYIEGYWQSYKYLVGIESKLRDELIPRKIFSYQDRLIETKIFSSEGGSVSLHVRRGDYVTNLKAAKNHGLCSQIYYEKAVENILSHVKKPHFFIFSDDIEWVHKNMTLPGKVTYVGHNGTKNAFQDLRLMSICDHHIVANSSFSWWGAWLSGKDEGCVIAPINWFADGRSTDDLTPSHWVRL
jgi:hypothetical protein